jgi:hypothetical protein
MADTIRDRDALLALLANNVSRDISPQRLRDFLVSVHGVYGGLYVKEADGKTQAVASGVAEIMEWSTVGLESGCTGSITTNDIIVGTAGVYKIDFAVHYSIGGGINKTAEFDLAIDGTQDDIFGTTRYLSSGAFGSSGFTATKSLSASAAISVEVELDDAQTFTYDKASLVVHRIS